MRKRPAGNLMLKAYDTNAGGVIIVPPSKPLGVLTGQIPGHGRLMRYVSLFRPAALW